MVRAIRLSLEAVYQRLDEAARSLGAAELAVPRRIVRVAELPLLGTGKTDLKGCRNLAIELTKDVAE